MQTNGIHAHLSIKASVEHPLPSPGPAAPVYSEAGTAHKVSDLAWPEDLLISFSLRMASHGMSISRIAMLGNQKYALQQLAYARGMGDPGLAALADELFRCYAASQADIGVISH